MSVNMNAMDLVFGIHLENCPAFKDYRESDRAMRHLFNSFTVIGWVPLAGTIAGVARLIFTAIMHKNDFQSQEHNRESNAFYAVMVIRGVLETLSLGFLLVIPDLILTAGRQIAFGSHPAQMPAYKSEYSSYAPKETYPKTEASMYGSGIHKSSQHYSNSQYKY